ncbi:MAG: TonB-dependent receptor domain-containing protein [Terriglobales bacterium]
MHCTSRPQRIAASACLLLLTMLAVPACMAAPDAGVSGTVRDQSGAVVQRARVKVVKEQPAAAVSTTTDARGEFHVENLAPGSYQVTVEAQGFASATQTVTLTGSGVAHLRFELQPGSVAQEMTVVGAQIVGGSARAQQVPGSLDVLDQKTLEGSRIFYVGEALRKVPGISVRDEEGFGLRPNISIRGLNPTRSTKVLLLEDGIPITYAPYGDNASYYHPPIERYSSIEVLKGSGQIVYGPTTVGGVINYLAPDPPADFRGSLTLMGGNRDYFEGAASVGGTWRNVGLLAYYLRKQGEGARENIRPGVDDLNVKATTTLGSRHAFTFRTSYYHEDSNITYSGLRLSEYLADPRQNPFRNDFFYGNRVGVSATHSFLLSANATLVTNLYGSHFDRDWWRQSSNSNQRPNDSADPACAGMANLNTTCGNEGRIRSYYVWGIEPHVRTSHSLFGVRSETDFGFRAHYEQQKRAQKNGPLPTSRDGVTVESNERRTDAYSFFVQNRFLLNKWSITPGVRVERIAYERTNRLANGGLGVTGNDSLVQVVPGLGVSYSPREKLTFFAGIHRGFSPPRAEDVVSNTGGVVELDPELSWNVEAGARTEPLRGLRLDATFFRMDYENQIVPASLAGGVGAVLTNGGQTLHEGFELFARADTGVLRSSPHNVYFRVNYTYLPTARFDGVRFSSVSGFGATSVTGNRLPYAPESLLTAGVGYSHRSGWDALLESVYVGSQFTDDLNTIATTADGQRGRISSFNVWNATLNYQIEAHHATLFVTVKNLFDRVYVVDQSRGLIPGNPRQVQSGVKFTF